MLLHNGANVNAFSRGDWTPLHTAVFHGRVQIAKVGLLSVSNLMTMAPEAPRRPRRRRRHF